MSQAYNLGQVAVNSGDALTQAGVEMNNARLYGDKDDEEQARNRFVSEFGKAQMSMGGMKGNGMGNNPYVPRSMRKTVKGGSFKTGGSFKGGSFKVSGKGVRPTTDESNFVTPNHPSFNAPKPDSYSGSGLKHTKCPCCGR